MPDARTRPALNRIGANIAFGVAAVVVLIVVPQVRMDPAANRDAATIAFLVNAVLNIGIGFALRQKVLLWLAALLALLLGLALLDAAFAFAGHLGMVVATVALFLCVLADLAAAVLAVIAAVQRRRSVAA